MRRHPLPGWYDDAKLGIFVHWTMAAVPAFAPRERTITELLRTRYADMQAHLPYTEWYENSLRFPDSEVSRHHRERHGEAPYASFREAFLEGISRWDPDAWAEAFARAGARYVVLVTKHHDGFCLWPSRVRNPRRDGWSSERDCVGELAAAVRARGLRFGVYYSGGLDWTFEPRPIANLGDVIAAIPGGDYPAYAESQVRELIERVRPDVLWNDIAWPTGRSALLRLWADYYNAVPEGVVNDRWLHASVVTRALRLAPLRALANALLRRGVERGGGELKPPPALHSDARTPEYAVYPDIRRKKWECVRGMDKSFGYNEASLPEDFLSRQDLVHGLVDIASKNGNLLLNVGPRGRDGGIPAAQLERLEWLGGFTRRYGEALFGTRPWLRAEARSAEGIPVRFTARGATTYAWLLQTPRGASVTLPGLALGDGGQVRRVGVGGEVRAAQNTDGGLRIAVDDIAGWPDEPAHALALSGLRA